MNSLTRRYTYQDLDPEASDSFRLLSLLPGEPDSPIICELRHARRTGPTEPYESVSYAWGDLSLDSEIILNGSLHPITRNLERALRSLRHGTDGAARTLWVDAICIDQSHVAERNHQVAQMGEIYAGGERVIVWLGDASKDSDTAILFMNAVQARLAAKGEFSPGALYSGQYLESDFRDTIQEFLKPQFDKNWDAVARLLSTTWWNRAWVVQELVIARDAIFQCGKSVIPWDTVENIIITFTSEKKLTISRSNHWFTTSGAYLRSWSISWIRYAFKRDGSIPLFTLLGRIRRQDCSDPRDKVYCILGMSPPELREQLHPDYTKDLCEVFTAAAVADMNTSGRLDALTLVDHGHRPHTERLPSWVADLRTVARGNLPWPKGPMPKPYIAFSENLRTLHTRGIMIDTVLETQIQGTSMPFNQLLPPDPVRWTWDLSEIITRLVDEGEIRTPKTTQVNAQQDLRRSVERTIYAVMTAGHVNKYAVQKLHDVIYPDEETHGETKSDVKSDIEAKPTAGHSEGGKTQQGVSTFLTSGDTQAPEGSYMKPIDWKILLNNAVNQTLGRTIILSSKRYLGLAPEAVESGDQVFALFGLRQLAILRPQDDDTYKFVGTAYVHGLMRGEWQEDLKLGLYESRIVTIR